MKIQLFMVCFVSVVFASQICWAQVSPDLKLEKKEHPVVKLTTDRGEICLELFPEDAPKHVESFLKLIEKGFYNGLIFHRVVPGFVIQGGDPTGNGSGGPGYTLPAEFNKRPHEKGTLAMARTEDVNSAGSQFYICLDRIPHLDGQYTVFGKVVKGMDVPEKVQQGDKMKLEIVQK
ncbi:MAG: peptidylprolyl isomerase [Candidatus Riflebacteria bacterium]|nr:peptidylprolyl isomerase [Candidatus Riflebacteria bacterium]